MAFRHRLKRKLKTIGRAIVTGVVVILALPVIIPVAIIVLITLGVYGIGLKIYYRNG